MGKTSLLREPRRLLAETGGFEVVFVDREAGPDVRGGGVPLVPRQGWLRLILRALFRLIR